MPDTTSAQFFEAKYADASDPWAFASSPYEQYRYERTFQALAHQHYQWAFEPGCSIGILTQKLATLCEGIDALDISSTAVSQAKTRCSTLRQVSVRCASLQDAMPLKAPDLLVLSEIGYYFEPDAWKQKVEQLVALCLKPATLIATHWLGHSPDHLISGDRVHTLIQSIPGLVLTYSERHGGFRLDRWHIE